MENIDEMEMPTPCVCGEWFDLNDGYASRFGNTSVCEECHNIELSIEGWKDEIKDLEIDIANGYNLRKNKKRLKECQAELKKAEQKYSERI